MKKEITLSEIEKMLDENLKIKEGSTIDNISILRNGRDAMTIYKTRNYKMFEGWYDCYNVYGDVFNFPMNTKHRKTLKGAIQLCLKENRKYVTLSGKISVIDLIK